jgi:hypothetical protein
LLALRVLTWKEMGLTFLGISGHEEIVQHIMFFPGLRLAAVGHFETMLMAVTRGKRDGLMRALGLESPAGADSPLLFEAGGIGTLGSTAGTILGSSGASSSPAGRLPTSPPVKGDRYRLRIAGVNVRAPGIAGVAPHSSAGSFPMIVSSLTTSRALKMEISECLRGRVGKEEP